MQLASNIERQTFDRCILFDSINQKLCNLPSNHQNYFRNFCESLSADDSKPHLDLQWAKFSARVLLSSRRLLSKYVFRSFENTFVSL